MLGHFSIRQVMVFRLKVKTFVWEQFYLFVKKVRKKWKTNFIKFLFKIDF